MIKKDKQKNHLVDPMFIPRTVSFLGSEVADVAKDIGDRVVVSFVTDLEFIRKNRGKGGINNFRLGLRDMKRCDIRLAVFRFWLATKFSPQSSVAYYYLGKCYNILGKTDKAINNLRIAFYLRNSISSRISDLIDEVRITHPDMVEKFIPARGEITPSERMVIKEAIVKQQKNKLFVRYIDKFVDFIGWISDLISAKVCEWREYREAKKIEKERKKRSKMNKYSSK